MPLREPRMELDRVSINNMLNNSGISLDSTCKFVMGIPVDSGVIVNSLFVYNRGHTVLEDTEKRGRACWIISIWTAPINSTNTECLYQIPVPIKMRLQ